MASTPIVHLLLSNKELRPLAFTVGDVLSNDFGIHVVIRSALTPSDQLLAATTTATSTNQRPILYTILGPTTSSTKVLETESTAPILALPQSDLTNPQMIALLIAKYCSLASPEVRKKVHKAVHGTRQARLVEDVQLRTQSPYYLKAIAECYDQKQQITGDAINVGGKQSGKVRDRFMGTTRLALVTTDRQSGFDRQLALVPYKGAVLNLISAFWFDQTKHIIPNHLLSVPHPYVSIVRKCKPFPIEFVVRSYMTGSTSTSIWKNYQNGVRKYCGHDLPDGMVKNQKLATIMLTPTTKQEIHDRPLSAQEVIDEGWMSSQDWDVCAVAAIQIFEHGQRLAWDHGLILVDTKYEFGRDEVTNEILLIDEVHTPDSSRYWLASTYEQSMAAGREPDNIDKEFLRLWFEGRCDPYKDEVLPEAPRDLVLELARRYITLYEMITCQHFDFDAVVGEEAISQSIKEHLA